MRNGDVLTVTARLSKDEVFAGWEPKGGGKRGSAPGMPVPFRGAGIKDHAVSFSA